MRSIKPSLRLHCAPLQKFEIALKTLGLNLTQDVIQDAENQYNDNGYIYYNDFCSIVAEHYRRALAEKLSLGCVIHETLDKLCCHRREDNEDFDAGLFRAMTGTKQYADDEPAAPYDVHSEFMTREQFCNVMTNLPEVVVRRINLP